MENFDIRATLGICPTQYCAREMLYISRGASATLNFNYGAKIYGFENTDQFTYILKQGKQIKWYKMFTYLVETEDTEVVEGKVYYTNLQTIEGDELQCSASEVEEPEANPSAAGYYEEVEGNCSWRDTKYMIDPHFAMSVGDGWEYISIILSPYDTMDFKPGQVECEVAIRLNTDSMSSLGNQDSIILEPQASIMVVDSLYSKLK